MDGSSPASAAHMATVQSHPFLLDFASIPSQTPLRDLLARVHPDPLHVLGSSQLAAHNRGGVTTRSVTFRCQTRLATRGVMDAAASSMSSIPNFTASSSMASLPSFATDATIAATIAAPPETRKRRAASSKTSGAATKKRRSQSKVSNLKKPPPGSEAPAENSPAGLKKDSDYGEENSAPSCCICMCEPEPADLATINGCQHKFCFDCIEKWADRENTCPLCKIRFSKIDRVNKPKRKKGEPLRKTSKQVKMRDQRSIPESALEGLVATFSAVPGGFQSQSIARLLFAGMGSGYFEFGPTRFVRAREVHFESGPRPIVFGSRSDLFDDPPLSSDDEDESISGFFSQMRRANTRSMQIAVPNPHRAGAAAAAAAVAAAVAPSGRSYAVNMDESTAGNAHNPLEIEDDSDDDEVEVVEVVTSVE